MSDATSAPKPTGDNGEAQRLRAWPLTTLILIAVAIFIYALWALPRTETIWRVSDGSRQYPFAYVSEELCDAVAQRANHNALGKYYCVPGVEYLRGWNHSVPSPAPRQTEQPSAPPAGPKPAHNPRAHK